MTTNAILTVSFGTSLPDVRRRCLDQIEEDIQTAHRGYSFYRAWTSRKILKKLNAEGYVSIASVSEAFLLMRADGIRRVFVQPTHIIPGIENSLMQQEALAFSSDFEQIAFGRPLLCNSEDHLHFIRCVRKYFLSGPTASGENYPYIPAEEALVFMGHGTEHHVNSIYAALDYALKEQGCKNCYVGTVEGYPDLDCVIRLLQKTSYRKLHLMPLMTVAGDHAVNDMAGEGKDSWRSRLVAEGYEVVCHMTGLGEYDFVRNMFLEHLEAVL